uniref:Uncharacterized protein n=1 Tax=Plectus sambesii TaxID=2011161 RepID=A0A914UYD1_9BILA
MFEYDPELDEMKAPIDSYAPEVQPGAGETGRLNPAQLMHTAMTKDMDMTATLASAAAAELKPEGDERMIVAVSTVEVVPAQATVRERQGPPFVVDEEVNLDPKQEEPSGGGILHKILNAGRFVVKLLEGTLDWLAAFFNRRSRDHRYVAFVLSREKTKLKEQMGA